ncbi:MULTISPECIES: deoxyribose-phosphate aldolase [unclassified Sinorhizobium]|uniref:deoxyribose-phosphate aldolase n=1 Tax=unclassified Sinorhizobium TaxID=2613772 RepID=UPI0024C286A4|nr:MULTISPECIES: deoxyribose-phosphate aldolase [unclassified Sinorhizobium]MDK1376798.1 deoxyribose-phosphate aldolase [Sinorhizobium sp. 6-70]MDK1479570.1 deoxyribose-phosphate aldolase [Sinorhizobium sp. 6-117]
MESGTNREIASLIDHTILSANARTEDIERYCCEAITHGFCSVVVNPIHVARVAGALQGTRIRTATVIGFPLGANLTSLKTQETDVALRQGADEIDVVIDLGAMADGRYKDVETELSEVRKISAGKILKVIIEACLLTDEGKIAASSIAAAVGADFIKTSTGSSTGGATVEDVALIRRTVGPNIGVKASGGIRTRSVALQMLDAGATRIGTSAGPLLLQH